MCSLNSLTFDTTDLQLDQENSDRKVWFNPDGDAISLYFFDKPPDLPAALHSAEQVRDFYLSMLKNTPAKLVESQIITLAGCPAIRLILKSPQEQLGYTYLGSFTIPFRDFSFVVKCQCQEYGTTGIREAILFDIASKSGAVSFDPSGKITGHPDFDAIEHDATFPQHPLSRLRSVLGKIAASAVLDPAVRNKPIFPLPAAK